MEQPDYSTGCIGVSEIGGDYEYRPKVREAVAEALGIMDENASIAIPALTKALQDKNELVRKAAAEAIEKIEKN